MIIEAPSNNPFIKFGDSIRGRFIAAKEETNHLDRNKTSLRMTLKTKSGLVEFNCPTDLKARVQEALRLGYLAGNPVVKCTYIADKNIGHAKPMKVIEFDVEREGAERPAIREPEHAPAPTPLADEFAGEFAATRDVDEIPF
jgi:hypothetical protein